MISIFFIDTPNVIHLRERTTSSSSDSIFTDPASPQGAFATEINEAYYSEENICDLAEAPTTTTNIKSALKMHFNANGPDY